MLIFMASPFSGRPGRSSQKLGAQRLPKNLPLPAEQQRGLHRVVVRQCRIGSSLAFSLVGVPQNKVPKTSAVSPLCKRMSTRQFYFKPEERRTLASATLYISS
ncbi:hypothetical protein Bpfe_026018 [Biomphalaria pfeifferi]|uniref:Uncharacterized protein n=1 Tax=Biomphalaria pfeifferi TaxID=112525 RepID=A0AAD8AY20_BIOPF|nr:hypothetical protein Bpfe_026018 [Biomphalaria pfeifferi]